MTTLTPVTGITLCGAVVAMIRSTVPGGMTPSMAGMATTFSAPMVATTNLMAVPVMTP